MQGLQRRIEEGLARRLARFWLPRIPQHPDRTRKILGDYGANGVGNGWAEIQPGELVHRHPLPSGQYWITLIEAGRSPLPYLGLRNQIDHVPVRRERLADDHQLGHPRFERQLLAQLAAQRRVKGLVTLQPAARKDPVALTPLAMLDEEDLVRPDNQRRDPQLRGD